MIPTLVLSSVLLLDSDWPQLGSGNHGSGDLPAPSLDSGWPKLGSGPILSVDLVAPSLPQPISILGPFPDVSFPCGPVGACTSPPLPDLSQGAHSLVRPPSHNRISLRRSVRLASKYQGNCIPTLLRAQALRCKKTTPPSLSRLATLIPAPSPPLSAPPVASPSGGSSSPAPPP